MHSTIHRALLAGLTVLVAGSVGIFFCFNSYTQQMKHSSQSSGLEASCLHCYTELNLSRKGTLVDEDATSQFQPPSAFPPCNLSTNMTIVTAFLNIGPFSKGSERIVRTSLSYRQWLKAFALIKNPVVAFFNNQSDLEYFRTIRDNSNNDVDGNNGKTQLIKIDLADLWAFQLAPDIAKVYAQENYPLFHPNTIFPGYTCATHSKYELTRRAGLENPFQTKYFMWIDAGYFRSISKAQGPKFYMQLPAGYSPQKVLYQEVYKRDFVTVDDVFLQKIDWVAGGCFVAEKSIMIQWCEQYMRFTEKMLARNLMNADQAIIYGMTIEMEEKPSPGQVIVDAHRLKVDNRRCPNYWMCIGYYSMCSVNSASGL